ncbi:MAG: response regulator transcription factor [Pseudomonadota bacterium]
MTTKVVIVDDHEVILSALKEQVESLDGFVVASTFLEMNGCLGWFETNDADILVLDIYIDSSYILNFIPKIRKTRPNLKVILISGNFSETISKCISSLQIQGIWEKLQNLDSFSKLLLQVAEMPEKSFDSRLALTFVTPREEEICILLAQGYSVKKVAKILNLADKTIDAHKANIMSKIGAKNQNELVKWSLAFGLIIL